MSWTPEQEQCVMCRKHAICWAPGLHGLQAEVSGAPKEAPRTGLRKIRPSRTGPASCMGPLHGSRGLSCWCCRSRLVRGS